MARTIYIKGINIQSILESWEKAVKTGQQKKISYQLWRRLKTLALSTSSTYKIEIGDRWYDSTQNAYCTIYTGNDCYTDVPAKFVNLLIVKAAATADFTTESQLSNYLGTTATSINDLATAINTLPTTVMYNPMKINADVYIDTKHKKEKENNTMMNMNLEFGPIKSNDVAISPFGIAIRKGSNWFTYNGNETVDVTGFTFDFNDMIYKIPVAPKELRPGDMVLHKGRFMYVDTAMDEDSREITVIDILDSEVKTILPVNNPMNFAFFTKVTSLFNFGGMKPDADNPFGNLMPIMLMQNLFDKDSDNSDFGKWMLMSAMMNGQSNPFTTMFGQN